jgi:hypothetical protein
MIGGMDRPTSLAGKSGSVSIVPISASPDSTRALSVGWFSNSQVSLEAGKYVSILRPVRACTHRPVPVRFQRGADILSAPTLPHNRLMQRTTAAPFKHHDRFALVGDAQAQQIILLDRMRSVNSCRTAASVFW